MRTCEARKKDGQPCPGPARPSGYCWVHDPELAGQRARGRRQGGRTRARAMAVLPPDAPDVPLRTVGDVVTLLAESINQTRKGQLDPRVANAVGYLASVLLRAQQDADLAVQLAELRRQVEGLWHAQRFPASRNGTHPHGPAAARPAAAARDL